MLKLDLKPSLEKKARILLGEDSNKIFEKVLSIEIEERRKAIKNIKNDLEIFEKKYNMSTEEFYNKWENGEFDDDNEDFFKWSGEYEILQEAKSELEQLEK